MPIYEIWCEGYRATGESGTASFMGWADAPTFREACATLMRDPKFCAPQYYNAERNTWWLCRLFDNERDAREEFG